MAELDAVISEALDSFNEYQYFKLVEVGPGGIAVSDPLYIPDFSKIKSAFSADLSLGELDGGSRLTLIPMDVSTLEAGLRSVYVALRQLEQPSYTIHTYHARVDHIIDTVRGLFRTTEFVMIESVEDLAAIVYPRGKKVEVKIKKMNTLGEFAHKVMGDLDDHEVNSVQPTGIGFSDPAMNKVDE
jgi:hypothetical protein